MSADDWFQYQAKKLSPKSTKAPRPPALQRPPPVRAIEPEPEPMGVEETTASDTAIQRIIKRWTK